MATPEDVLRELEKLKITLEEAITLARLNPKQVTIINGLSEIANSLGTITAGEFLALSSGEDPQDANGTGTFMSALGRLFGSKTYHIGGVHNGDLKWGVNSLTGELEAGDGAVALTESGLSIYNGTTEIARLGNLNGFLGYSSNVYGLGIGDSSQYLTYDQTNGLKVYGAIISDRIVLSSTLYLYVDASADAGGNGLSPTTAFQTIQEAIDLVSTDYDVRDWGAVINIADGTYAFSVDPPGTIPEKAITLKSTVGTGTVTLLGNTTDPTQVVVSIAGSGTGWYYAVYAEDCYTPYTIKGISFSSTHSAGPDAIVVADNSKIKIQSCIFGTGFDRALVCSKYGIIRLDWLIPSGVGGCSITGDYTIFCLAQSHGTIILVGGLTLTDTPTFSTAFAQSIWLGLVYSISEFTGAATGKRYDALGNGVIVAPEAGATYFPGDVAGTTATGGQYVTT